MSQSTPVRRRVDGELTRRKVLDAAVQSILESGYYHTSSNEIARRADVTWGTLQHQFGSREGLLLAVLEASWADLQEAVATAVIAGDTLEDRPRPSSRSSPSTTARPPIWRRFRFCWT